MSKKKSPKTKIIGCQVCGEATKVRCKCGMPVCSRQNNPQCYFIHSEDMMAIEQHQGTTPIPDRHPISGVNPIDFLQDSAKQGDKYGQESGPCVKCWTEVTKRCRHCRLWVCRPTENSRLCMAVHLREAHKIEPVFWIM